MTNHLFGKGAIVVLTRGKCLLWAVSDPAGTKPILVENAPDDQHQNHFRQAQRNRLRGTDTYDRWYLATIAEYLDGAREILLIGHGNGRGSEVHQFQHFLTEYRPELANAVVGVETLNVVALTENQLLAVGKQWYATTHAHH